MVFPKIKDREEEILLLKFVISEAKANNELIASLEEFEVETKSNGILHKGKETKRLALIKKLEKENDQYRKFFKARNKPTTLEGSGYQYRKEISERRKHLEKEKSKDI